MSKFKSITDRRDFLKICSFSSLPILVPTVGLGSTALLNSQAISKEKKGEKPSVNFISDGLFFSPQEYLQKLDEINRLSPIEPDFYGNGGVTKKLEEEFAKLTGKEKAIFLPTGTMANQLAIKLLNDHNTKVIVPENSHIFRDEADAAQAVHGKRLIPAGKGKSYFNLQELKDTIAYYEAGEVFKSGLGTVTIENPIRRADEVALPFEIIKEISNYCREKGYKLHLDGARLHIASAYTGISTSEYASYFDTVYISLYKYLNASGGAVLCGDMNVIDKIAHQIKIYGGTIFQTWSASAMALHYLNGIEERWKSIIKSIEYLFLELNKINEIDISKIDNGTNIYNLILDKSIDVKKFKGKLYNDHNIRIRSANFEGIVKLIANESLLRRDPDYIISAWKHSINTAKK